MKITSAPPIKLSTLSPSEGETSTNTSFKNMLKEVLGKVNELQVTADSKALGFSYGYPDIDIHDVMIDMEKAHLALQLTIEVRNKLVEAYQEIMRMQL